MQRKLYVVLLICAMAFLQSVDAEDFCYRASITIQQPTRGDVSSRKTDVENAVSNMLIELDNGPNLGFTTNGRNQTLEDVLGDSSTTEFQVLICLQNSSKTQDEFTQILVDFSFTTQIDSNTVTAGDFDECGGDFTTNCHELANCNNNNGSFACVCLNEYFDASENNQTGQLCELPTNFTCSSNTVNVTAYKPYFDGLGIDYTVLFLGSCGGTVSGDDILYAGECGAAVEENATHVFYKWNLTNVNSSSDVTIGNYVTIPITCTFLSSSNVSFNVSAERRDIIFNNDLNNLPGQAYDFTADAFSDSNVRNQLSGAINTNTKIFFELGTSNNLPSNVIIRCDSFSTSAADGSSRSIDLMRGSCPVTRTNSNGRIWDTLQVVRNGESASAVIGINSHFFGTSRVTLATFSVVACVETEGSGGGSGCQISCQARRKRHIINYRVRREDVESGEVQFAFERVPGDGCTKDCNEGGLCVYDATRNQQCVCADGFVKQQDGTCREMVDVDSEDTEPGKESTVIILLTSFIAILALLAVAFVLVFVFRRRRNNQKQYDVTLSNSYAMDQKHQ